MSIAVAVVLRPSRLLRVCTVFFSLFLASIGVYLGCLNTLSAPVQFVLVVLCLYTAWCCFLYGHNMAKVEWRISVDGQGHIRCQSNTLDLKPPVAGLGDDVLPNSFEGMLFNLMSGTTLWANCLFLRLRNPDYVDDVDDVDDVEHVIINLIIFPDALDKDAFRRLSVACRWIAARPDCCTR